MPSSIFTRCLLFKEISEFCLNPVWSIEISFRIAANFPPSHQIRPTADLLRFPLHCPDHPLLCHLQHPKVSRGASSSPWEGKYCSRHLHSLQTMKTLPQAKRHELSLQVNFGTIFTCLTIFTFFVTIFTFLTILTSWTIFTFLTIITFIYHILTILALVGNLILCHPHLHCLLSTKLSVAPLALVGNLATGWRHLH